MSIFRKLRDYFKQPNLTQELCTTIKSYGLDAKVISPDEAISSIVPTNKRFVRRFPVYIGSVVGKELYGTIEISNCLIHWINIVKLQGYEGPADYIYVLVIPDARVRGAHPIHVKTSVHKNIPWVGHGVSLKWTGNEYATYIADRLNDLPSVNQSIIININNGTGSDVLIDTENTLGYWLLIADVVPTSKLCESYQTIARELLASPIL